MAQFQIKCSIGIVHGCHSELQFRWKEILVKISIMVDSVKFRNKNNNKMLLVLIVTSIK